MNNFLKRELVSMMRKTADKIDAGNCEISSQEAIDLLKLVSHEVLSKDQACSYLNMSRSKFDSLVKDGLLPKGKKRRGFKELVWYEDELNEYIR